MKNKRTQFSLAFAILALIILVTATAALAAHTLRIDHFDATQYFTVTRPATTGFDSVIDAAALGGDRDIYIYNVTGDDTRRISVDINLNNDSLFTTSYDTTVNGNIEIQWDGPADQTSTVNYTGLGARDLTDGGTKDRIVLAIRSSDLSYNMIFRVFEDAAHCSQATVTVPPAIQPPTHVSMEILFTDFTESCPTIPTAVQNGFTQVGALTMLLEGVPNMDTQLHFVESTDAAYRDFGDLPASYGVMLVDGTNGGARHTLEHELWLGAGVDGETDGTISVPSNAEPLDDGVVPVGNWADGTGEVEVTVGGVNIGETACLSAWIDNNQNFPGFMVPGSFDDPERIFDRRPVTIGGGAQLLTFAPVMPIANGNFYARFRLYPDTNGDGSCADEAQYGPNGEIFGGEVEDYLWSFGPTAVTLSAMSARSTFSTAALAAIGAAGMLALLSAYALLARRRSE